MATAAVTITAPDTHLASERSFVATVANMANGDNCAAIPVHGSDEVSFMLFGTLGAGGSVTLEGSFDGTNWGSLPAAPGGSAIAATALATIYSTAITAVRYARLRVTAGDGSTLLAPQVFLRSKYR